MSLESMRSLAAALPNPYDVCHECEVFPLSASDKTKDGVCVDCRHKHKRQEERECITAIKYQFKREVFEQRKIQLQDNATRKLEKEKYKTFLTDKKFNENAQIRAANIDHIRIKHDNLPNINIPTYKPKQRVRFTPY